jgi:hypothetical protein
LYIHAASMACGYYIVQRYLRVKGSTSLDFHGTQFA